MRPLATSSVTLRTSENRSTAKQRATRLPKGMADEVGRPQSKASRKPSHKGGQIVHSFCRRLSKSLGPRAGHSRYRRIDMVPILRAGGRRADKPIRATRFPPNASDTSVTTPRACGISRTGSFNGGAREAPRRTFRAGLVIGVCLTMAGRSPVETKDQKHMAEKTSMMELTKSAAPAAGRVALAATWEAKEGEGDAVADILRRMAEAVKTEPGTLLFWPHRSPANDRVFFLYELFADDAAFAAHQQTDAFKTLVVGQALPKLARRERVQLTPFQHESMMAP